MEKGEKEGGRETGLEEGEKGKLTTVNLKYASLQMTFDSLGDAF